MIPGAPGLALAAILALSGCGGHRSADSELRALVDSLLPRLEQVSGLRAVGPVRLERRDRVALRSYIAGQLAKELPPEELAGIQGTYHALGLLPDTLDLRRLLLDLFTEQVMGYYDPETGALYLVEGVPASALRTVLAHELVHALQDQHVDLDSLVARERGNDRQTAAQAAIEGHATLEMVLMLAEAESKRPVDVRMLPDLSEQLRPALEAENSQFPVFRSAPRILRETLLFPYLDGAGFVQKVWSGSGAARPMFRDLLPASTEQVLHPAERFVQARDDPVEVRFAAPPADWRVVYENTLGELEIGIFLTEHLGPAGGVSAHGWDGDRFRLLQAADGRRALVLYSVWDDAPAADRFAEAYRTVLTTRADRHGRVERLEISGRPAVLVLDAPRATPLDQVPTGSARIVDGTS